MRAVPHGAGSTASACRAGVSRALADAGLDQRGEVLPIAILFGGVLLTVMIGLHVVLGSLARSAVQSAAERGVTAAQTAQPGDPTCGTLTWSGDSVTPANEQECRGVFAAWTAMGAVETMVDQIRLPNVSVDEAAGIVSVRVYGSVFSPVLGGMQMVGHACGPMDLLASGPGRADPASC